MDEHDEGGVETPGIAERMSGFWHYVYTIAAFAGGILFTSFTLSNRYNFPLITGLAALICFVLSALLATRSRKAIPAYISLGLLSVSFAIYRLVTSETNAWGMLIAGIAFVLSFPWIAEGLHRKTP